MGIFFGTIATWSKRTALIVSMGAAAAASQAETLADALVGAYNHAGLLDQNRAVLRAADEGVAQAASTLLPVVSWSANLGRNFGDIQGANTTSLTAQLIASWQVFDFGADQARIDAQKETVLATRAALINVEQQVLFLAVQAFMNVRAEEETVAIRENNIRLLREELRAAQDRFDVGEVTRTDVALAQSALAAAQSNLALSRANLQQQREAYRVAVGRYPGRLSPPPALPRLEQSIDRARAFAVRNHPSLRQAQHQVAANELLVTAAERDMKPVISLNSTLSVTENFGRPGDVAEGLSVGIGAQGPIYQGGRLSSLVRSAMANRDSSRANLHVVRHDVFSNVGTSYATLRAATAQIAATEQQIRAARTAFEGIREEATLGARTTLDVLDAEQTLLDALASRVSAQAQQYIAAYSVLSSMGLLTAESLKLPVQIYDPAAYYELVKDGVPAKTKQGQQLDRVLRALNK